MDNSSIIWIGELFSGLVLGCVIGYYIRQSIAKKRAGSLEAKLTKKVQDTKEETVRLVKEAEAKSSQILEKTQKEVDERRREFLKAQQLVLDREKLLEEKINAFDKKETDLAEKVEKLKVVKEDLDKLRQEAEGKLEKVANLTREDA
jgi:ribonuclease Y